MIGTNKFTEEQRNFISFMKENTASSKDLSKRVALCLENTSLYITNYGEIDFTQIREQHNPAITAEFLSLFGSPDGLKFLTHDFDPDSEIGFKDIIKQASNILDSPKFRNRLPKSLSGLIKGFISGPKWIDRDGINYEIYLTSRELKEWTNQYPFIHPITSNEFGILIQNFRNTVRLSKPTLPQLIRNIISNNSSLKNLNLTTLNKLDKADFYTNVFILKNSILKVVLLDIAQRDSSLPVEIKYCRDAWNEYRLHEIVITHVGSEANPFDDVKNKLMMGGGALFNILKKCKGYCDWTIEANFEGEFKRWRILNFRNLPEVESIGPESVKGFSHIFTFYKYR